MSLLKTLRRLAAGLVSLTVLLTPLAGSFVTADIDVEPYYEATLTASENPTVGEPVTFTAIVNYVDGDTVTPVTDLSSTDLAYIYFWNNTSDCALDDNCSGGVFTTTYTFDEAGDYDIQIAVQDSGWHDIVDIVHLNLTVATAGEEETPDVEPHYEAALTASENPTVGEPVTFTAIVNYVDGDTVTPVTDFSSTDLAYIYFWNNTSDCALDDNCSGGVFTTTYTFLAAGTYTIQARLQDSSWADIITPFPTVTITVSENDIVPVEGDLNFDGVNIPDDFYMGVDISSVVSEINAGVVYYDYEGNALTSVSQFVAFLASQGVNCVRVRVWNNPYDVLGNGFGGGNNDVAAARMIADACEAAGITMLVDFHLSDFWCDPNKQPAPIAWESMSVDQKAEAIRSFVIDSLNTIDPNGNTVVMVQIGNETNNKFCGVSDEDEMCVLFDAGCDAVHDWNADVLAVIHFANPERSMISNWAVTLHDAEVSADVLATSYYPYWHGSLSNLTTQLRSAGQYYQVMVAETSYAYTLEDSDGHENTVREGSNDSGSDIIRPFTVQGQAVAVRDVIAAVNSADGIGMFYWEPAWITVGDTTGLSGDDYESRVGDNRALWEEYGCGWASSYAAVYDPADAGQYYGGSAVDNQALFYPDGTPTAAWGVYENIRTGEYSTEITADGVETFSFTITEGDEYSLPETAIVTYSNGSTSEEPVTWDADQVRAITGAPGTYVVNGTCMEFNTTFILVILPVNLIDDSIAGFETSDYEAAYTVEGTGISSHNTEDPRNGTYDAHWYASEANRGSITLNDAIVLESAGTYAFTGYTQGDNKGSNIVFKILNATTLEVIAQSDAIYTDDWNNWQSGEVSITVSEPTSVILVIEIDYPAGGWGTVDDLLFYQVTEAQTVSEGENDVVVPDTDTDSGAAVVTTVSSASPVVVNVGEPALSPIEAVINDLYEGLLGRTPDEEGMRYWRTRLESGQITLRELVIGIVMSPEYLSKGNSDEVFVGELYASLLGREADIEGAEYWVDGLSSGDTRIDTIDGFIYSPEFAVIAEENGLKIE